MKRYLIPIGTICEIITEPGFYGKNNVSGHEFPIGTIVKIVNHDGDDDEAPMAAEYEDGRDFWYINVFDVSY